MSTLPDFDHAVAFAIPVAAGGPAREGMLIEGPQGWGEFAPGGDVDLGLGRWLTAATEPGTVGWPDPLRGRVPVALAIPAVAPERAGAMAAAYVGRTVDVVVSFDDPAEGIARLQAVRDAVGAAGSVRCTAHGQADARWVKALVEAGAGVDLIEFSGCDADDLAQVRGSVDVRIGMDASTCDASRLREICDVAVLRTGPLGGVRRALRVAESCGLPCVVSSSGESSVGLAGGVALAGALPDLPFACGLGTVGLLAGDVVSDARSLLPVDGYLPVAPMPPGPDRQRLERFTVTDPAVAARWRERLRRARLSA